MDLDPPVTVGDDRVRRPKKMLPSQDKDERFQQNENEMKWDITCCCKVTI